VRQESKESLKEALRRALGDSVLWGFMSEVCCTNLRDQDKYEMQLQDDCIGMTAG
jgi:hypothetical protein